MKSVRKMKTHNTKPHKMKRKKLLLWILPALLLCSISTNMLTTYAQARDPLWDDVYDGLKNRKRIIRSESDEIMLGMTELQEKAADDNDGKRMGDFYFYEFAKSIGGDYTWNLNGEVKYRFVVKYRYGKNTQARFERELKNVMKSLHLTGRNDYDKVVTIHDFITDTVEYEDSGSELQYTAAGALLNRKAVCAGYALLFYRMCKEAKIPVNFISGYGMDWGGIGTHGWNIVRLGDKWYNVDVTWDDVSNNQFFLKSEEDFTGHIRDMAYLTDDFEKKHPMAEVSLPHP